MSDGYHIATKYRFFVNFARRSDYHSRTTPHWPTTLAEPPHISGLSSVPGNSPTRSLPQRQHQLWEVLRGNRGGLILVQPGQNAYQLLEGKLPKWRVTHRLKRSPKATQATAGGKRLPACNAVVNGVHNHEGGLALDELNYWRLSGLVMRVMAQVMDSDNATLTYVFDGIRPTFKRLQIWLATFPFCSTKDYFLQINTDYYFRHAQRFTASTSVTGVGCSKYIQQWFVESIGHNSAEEREVVRFIWDRDPHARDFIGIQFLVDLAESSGRCSRSFPEISLGSSKGDYSTFFNWGTIKEHKIFMEDIGPTFQVDIAQRQLAAFDPTPPGPYMALYRITIAPNVLAESEPLRIILRRVTNNYNKGNIYPSRIHRRKADCVVCFPLQNWIREKYPFHWTS